MLNNDIEADPRWMEELVSALDRHPEAGSAASRIMLYDRRDTLHSAGDLYRRNGTPDSRGVWQPLWVALRGRVVGFWGLRRRGGLLAQDARSDRPV